MTQSSSITPSASPCSAVPDFVPTPASIPPAGALLHQALPASGPVNHHPLNPLGFLLRAAMIYPDKLALVHVNAAYSFAQWAQRVQNLAYALIRAGVRPSDRVAVIAPNCPMAADSYQGILAARAVITPINIRLTMPEVEYILEHSGASLVLVDLAYVDLVPSSFPADRVIVSHDTGRLGCPYEAFLEDGRAFSKERGWAGLPAETDEDAACSLCYTSGTTGRPKGVVGVLRASYLGAVAIAYEMKMDSSSTYLWTLPMFHVCGWLFPWACSFAFATQLTLRTIDNAEIWRHLTRSRVTHYCAAPTVQIGLLNDENAVRLPQPVTTMLGGAAPTAQLIGELESRSIFPVHSYGATEVYGPLTKVYTHPHWASLPLADRARLMARQGLPMPAALAVRVVYPPADNDTLLVDVPRDGRTMGEVVTRGNQVMKEYFRDPEATARAFRGGWYGTGDLAVHHLDGSIAVLDRSKDIIISGGENASTLAIEQELAGHPDVREVAVVARPHARWGERPMAFVILHAHAMESWAGREGAFEEVLKKYSRSKLPGFARPEWVRVVDVLPKTSTGKIQKTELRKVVAKL